MSPHPLRVLIADDDKATLDTLRATLESLGIYVETVSTGRAALAALRERGGAIDALILDLSMPDKDGFEVMFDLREGFAGRLILITSIPTATSDSAAIYAQRVGLNYAGTLYKPVRSEQMAEMLGIGATGGLSTPALHFEGC